MLYVYSLVVYILYVYNKNKMMQKQKKSVCNSSFPEKNVTPEKKCVILGNCAVSS